ncbi:LysR family transcriptional regulator [Oceanimonas baumannii]|uniref:LysR family transcriptional regulator n=1 Tax=Oceanimonas baumannii TaxID=129578 RepID=UPI001D187C1D|nr:LysR family transcriptional regulator [Oceanimonas baumannii]MCC4264494.1 LysR family transcriptional regulator [Oceanimonas baumannii]
MPRTDDLILFSQVIELGSFSKAADTNGLTNSVVSKRIARLEQELGSTLIHRTTRRLTLTEAGRVLFERAQAVAQTAQEAFDAVTGYSESLQGHIRMSVPTISGELLLAEAVAQFCELHPGITVDMSLENRFVDVVGEGYDLVVRTGHLEDSSLVARHFIDSRWTICAAPAYLSRHGKPQAPEDLLHHNCLIYSYQESGARDWLFSRYGETYSLRVNGNFSTDNSAALRKAALAGYGLAYVPRCLVYPDLQAGRLVELLTNRVGKVLGIYAVYPYNRQPSRKIKLLIEHLRERYADIKHYF